KTRVAFKASLTPVSPIEKTNLAGNQPSEHGVPGFGIQQTHGALAQQNGELRLYGENSVEDDWWLTQAEGNLTSLVISPRANLVQAQPPGSLVLTRKRSWWRWGVTSGLLLASALGFGVGRATRLSASLQPHGDDIFLATAQDIIHGGQNDNSAAILMLAQVEDPRTASYLADLLSQTSQPETLSMLQQALISQGLQSMPSLLALSQGLENDLQQPLDEATRQVRLEQRHVVQGAIAKLLAVHSNTLIGTNLERVNLSLYHDGERTFRLIQPGLSAPGTHWQDANLSQANLTGANFFDVGPDGKPNTYDDIISELSGIDLTAASLEKANLQGAQVDGANLKQANLTDANLAYGNFTHTQLSNAQLMHVNAAKSRWQGSNLVGADLTQAIFDDVQGQQARLNRIDAAHSHWHRASLSQSQWVGANLMGADFNQADLTYANFQGANLDGANLSQADLRQANLRDTDLRQANLTGVTLTDADFAGAVFDDGKSLSGSFITPKAQLSKQNLQGVNFSRVRNLDGRQLNYICAQGGIHPSCEKQPAQ
ncbi:MAG: pentapeptide repeat-containing protein, partial [Cyanobacteria bacterium J06642_11]